MFIVYINLQILASIFYSLFHIFYLLLVYCTYFIFSILLLEALITEEPSGEHKFSGGWLLFLFIFSHIHIKDYYNLLLKRIQKIRDHLFLTGNHAFQVEALILRFLLECDFSHFLAALAVINYI